jgi:hypothetical protein
MAPACPPDVTFEGHRAEVSRTRLSVQSQRRTHPKRELRKFLTHNVQSHSLSVNIPRLGKRMFRSLLGSPVAFMASKLHQIFSRWSVFDIRDR